MLPLTCPIPENINPLQSNGFMFSIVKLPEIKYFCQEVTLPNLDAPAAEMGTPLVNTPIPGEKLSFGDLSITFLIDEQMKNYIALHDWMIGLGFPKSHAQYTNFVGSRLDELVLSELSAGYSDAVLQVLDSSNNPSRSIQFVDVFPTALNQITLTSTTTDTQYLAATATFQYTYYQFT